MSVFITLITNPDALVLQDEFIGKITAHLQSHGLVVNKTSWLADGVACDLLIKDTNFTQDVAREIKRICHQIIANMPIDLVVQGDVNRRKKLLISDMDSTMITVECIDELADFAGIKPQVALITERAMRGEIDFSAALSERVALLRGLPEKMLEETLTSRIRMMPGAKALVTTMRKNGAYTALVSGGFTFFTERVAQELGFDAQYANVLILENGQLTGKVMQPIMDKFGKEKALMRLIHHHNLRPDATMAVGDGANDIPMLQAAGIGVAYHAKPIVNDAANVQIMHTDLVSLLYLQGYNASEIYY